MKNMKLYVRNKREIESSNDVEEPHVIISINYPKSCGEEAAKPIRNKYTREVLSLYFSDVGRLTNPLDDDAKSNPRCIPFNPEMAREVIDLIERNKIEHVVIHCLGGISRSASMAHAITAYFDCKRASKLIVINELVYMTMLHELIRKYG